MELKKRSALKSFIWRIVGVVILALVTYGYTKSWITTGWITVLHHGTFLIVFYLHERFWLHVDFKGLFGNMVARSMFKCLTYETLLGNFILGIITLIITGNIHHMTQITLTYIGIKHVIFIINEFIWKKIRWGIYNKEMI